MIWLAFHSFASQDDPRAADYLAYLDSSRRMLAATNPDWQFCVLTDELTSLNIPQSFMRWEVCASRSPLMVRTSRAAAAGLRRAYRDNHKMAVVADSDCLALRPLAEALHPGSTGAFTYNDKSLRLTNIAYTKSLLDMADAFETAGDMVEQWPKHLRDWHGDQEALDIAVGEREGEPGTPSYRGGRFHLLPCSTHNAVPLRDGTIKHRDAFILHFKGERKENIAAFVHKWETEASH